MENVISRYKRPISSIDDPEVKVEHWDSAIDAFDEKNFKKAALEVINYINPKLLAGQDTNGKIEIIQTQGSAEIHVIITDTEFIVKAPFLRITEQTNQVALLRKVAEVNFSPLSLAQICLEKDELWFEYEMPIDLCQPNKVYDILREVCVFADDYDDMFIEKYNAEFYKEPKHSHLTASEKTEVWSQINEVFEDYNNYTQFLKDKRWDDFQWDNLVICMLKLSNMPYIHGSLRSDLVEYISNLFNSNIDFKLRMDKGNNFMKKLTSKSEAEVMKYVYHADQFLSLRYRSSEQIVTDRLKGNLEQVQAYERDESYFNLSYYLQFTFLKLIYDFTLEKNYKTAIEDVLEEVAGLDPSQAGPKLAKVYHDLYNGTVNDQEVQVKKGFFSKLFS